jgi:phosphatidylserine/phosphatidylglycerophosphate/cardiolipin synthase-like enzyme
MSSIALWLGAALAAAPSSGASGGHVSGRYTVSLAESVPRGTALDDPQIPAAAAVWLDMIGSARRTIHLEQFYVSPEPGEALDPVLDALAAAGARGVAVDLVADAKFAKVYPAPLAAWAERPAHRVRALDLQATAGGVQHAKFFVVDGREAYLGSQNFDWRALTHIHELGIRTDAPPVVAGLEAIFAHDWARAAGEPAPAGAAAPPGPTAVLFEGSPATVELVASPESLLPPGVPWDLPRLVAAVDGAASRVRWTSLSISEVAEAGEGAAPWTQLTDAFRRAGARGVSVEVLVSHWGLKGPKGDALRSLAAAPGVAVRVLTVPPFSEADPPFSRVNHAKFLTVDGSAAWLGTSNLSLDYFFRSRNVGLMLTGGALVARLDGVFTRLWSAPYAGPPPAAPAGHP